jgi:hypothetical protein
VIWLADVHNPNLHVIVSDAPFYFEKHSWVDGKGYEWLYLPRLQLSVFPSCHLTSFLDQK